MFDWPLLLPQEVETAYNKMTLHIFKAVFNILPFSSLGEIYSYVVSLSSVTSSLVGVAYRE